MATLLFARELVLKVDTSSTGFDHAAHQLIGVERTAEAGLGVGHDWDEPVNRIVTLGPRDLVGARQCIVESTHHRGHAVGWVEALVGVDLAGQVAVGRDLPAAQVDGLEATLDHLDGLAAGEGAEGVHVMTGMDALPELRGAALGKRVRRRDRAAQLDDFFSGVDALNASPAGVLRPLGLEFCGLLCAGLLVAHGGCLR